jgi:hypothetical protein
MKIVKNHHNSKEKKAVVGASGQRMPSDPV